jgi:hypothetical protein
MSRSASLGESHCCARGGGLYRGAGLLARWPRGFARSGRLAALEKAARRTAPRTAPHVRTALPRFAREGGPLNRGAGLLARCPRNLTRGMDVSLRSWRRPLSWSGAPGPLAAQLYAEWTSRFAREGGPEDRPTDRPAYSAPRTVPYLSLIHI